MREKNAIYKSLITSGTWTTLRAKHLAHHPLCSRCESEGRTKLAEEVHHINPIERGKTPEEMRRLAYDRANLQSLCKDCHFAIHNEMESKWNRKKNREQVQKQLEEFRKNWL